MLAQASLLPAHVRVASGRRAAALAAGHLDAAAVAGNGSAAAPPRKAVVAVLTAGWTLLLFDHNLRLLWEHSLAADFPGGWAPREGALLVAATPLSPGDRGAVFVAASAARPDSDAGDALTPSAAFSAFSSRKSEARRRDAGELCASEEM